MDDQFLNEYREPPRPEFARQLQEKIEGETMKTQTNTWRRTLTRWSPALIAGMILLALVLVVSLPPTRALAQDFLNLFRVKRFAALTVDPARAKELENLRIDTEQLFGENMQVLKETGKPVKVASVQEASDRAGFRVAVPTALPKNHTLEVYVQGEGSGVFTANAAKLQEVLDLTGVKDVSIPAQLDGAKITVTKPAAVELRYAFKNGKVSLMQAPSPEVELPPGVDLKQLAEIGLRVLGLSADEARSFANKVDWRSTFLVPIPANAAEVRQVSVNGADGLLLTSKGQSKGNSPYASSETVLLWAKGGMVFAMYGELGTADMLEYANSVQ
jgi:hypothetical protein